MSNLGKWTKWYCMLQKDNPEPYGVSETYQLGANWLQDCSLIEDWGCGKGWFSKFVSAEQYVGIEGSHTPFASKIVDLENYQSSVPGIFMRHVLEHNYEWKIILINSLKSFTERMVLILYTPLSEETHELTYIDNPGVPEISFALQDILDIFDMLDITYHYERLYFPSGYDDSNETIFYLEKRN